MNKILFVDIDTSTFNIFSDLLKAHPDKFEILTAGSAREVPNIVSGIKISMIVLDLKMPDIDDMEFLSYMSKNYPQISVIVMTAFGTPEIEEQIKNLGTCRYYEKPVDIESLTEKIFEELGAGVGGQIRGIGLSSFLQMSEMESTTCALKIISEGKTGFIYLKKGELIAAELGTLTGNKAAFEIISWDNPVIEIENEMAKKAREIKMPLMNILMEGLRIKDEKAAAEIKPQEDKKAPIPDTKEINHQQVYTPEPKAKKQAKPEIVVDLKKESSQKNSKPIQKKKAKKKDPVKKTGGKRSVLLPVSLISIALLAGIGFFLWTSIIHPKLIKDEYNKMLQKVGELSILEEKDIKIQNYIDTHPKSPMIQAAKTKILEIKNLIQERDFRSAVSRADGLPLDNDFKIKAAAIYQNFLKSYPESPHSPEIKERLAEISGKIDENDFKKIEKISNSDYDGRLSAFKVYLKAHPYGKYRKKVEKLKFDLADKYLELIKKQSIYCGKKGNWDSCLAMCDKFTKNFINHPKLISVNAYKKIFGNKKIFMALQKKAIAKRGNLAGMKKVYMDYLKANPSTPLKNRIQSKLTKINKWIRDDNNWKKMRAYALDEKISIFERINLFKKYIDSDAAANYKKPAVKVLSTLNQQKQKEIKRLRIAAEEKKRREEQLAEIRKEKARIQKAKLKLSKILGKSGGRYVVNIDGTVKDTRTGLMWYILDTSLELRKCLNYDAATEYVKHLKVGGYHDWRLPTAGDLLVILNNEPHFPPSGAKWYWTSDSYWKGFHEIATIVKIKRNKTWIKDEADLGKCGFIRAVRH